MAKPASAWVVKDENKLLEIAMESLAGSAHVSFEGDLSGLALRSLPGASEVERPALKRNTIWPQQDFVVLPLKESLVRQILAAYGGTLSRRILHVQIENEGRLELGLYDNPECLLFVSPTLHDSLISRLQSENAVKPQTKSQKQWS